MAPLHESLMNLNAGSPIPIMVAMAAVAVVVLASLTLVALMCACGKKARPDAQSSVIDQPQVQYQPPEQQLETAPEEAADEGLESAKTAVEASVHSEASLMGKNAPDLLLSSEAAKTNTYTGPAPRRSHSYCVAAGLELIDDSTKSKTAQPSVKSLRSITAGRSRASSVSSKRSQSISKESHSAMVEAL